MTKPKETEFITGYCYGLLCREFNHAYAVGKSAPVDVINACIDVPRAWFSNEHGILDTTRNSILNHFEGQYKELTLSIKTTQIKEYIRFTLYGAKPRKLTKYQIESILGYKIEIVEE